MSKNYTTARQFAWKTVALASIIALLLPSSVTGRVHTLKIRNDARKQFVLTTFGFYVGGYLRVNFTNFQIDNVKSETANLFGFTLDKTSSDSISSYLESHEDKCILSETESPDKKADAISIIFFTFNFKERRLEIRRKGDDLHDLSIHLIDHASPITSAQSTTGLPSTSTTSDRNKREAKAESEATTPGIVASTNLPSDPTTGIGGKDSISDERTITDTLSYRVSPPGCDKDCHIFIEFKVDIKTEKEEGLYNLYFHNCDNYKRGSESSVSFTVELEEKNEESYLSAGDMPLPTLYFVLGFLYFVMAWVWLVVLRKSKEDVFKLHYIMLSLVYIKSLALLFHAINYHFIGKDGHPIETWAVLYYIIHLLKGALLFITIILIGAGWTFVKHVLTDKDKKIFMIVIPLQVLANIAQIIIDESEEGQSQYTTWTEVLILVDLLCCGAILFPVVWSIRHLQEASQTDGKAAISLVKLKLFRQFYIMIVCYIYFTRIIVYLVKITAPFQYQWLDEFFKECATIFFFLFTGYRFRPASNNPYLQIPQDDEDDIEMDEVLTETGLTESLSRVTKTAQSRTHDDVESGGTGNVSKRESSHEYD